MQHRLRLPFTAAICAMLLTTSCATTKYPEGDKNLSHLQTGRTYVIKSTSNAKGDRLIFTNIENGVLHGYNRKHDSIRYTIPVNTITEVRDNRKASAVIAGGIIGAAGVSALVISSTRAD